MKYQSDSKFIYLSNTPFNRKQELKEELGGTWFDSKGRGKGWRYPRTLGAYRELWKAFPSLQNDPKFIADGKEVREYVDMMKEVKNMPAVDNGLGLRTYQEQDRNFLSYRGSSLVLNEPRTGKTPTMISVMNALGTRINLIVCPSSLVLNWATEFEKWYPSCEVYPVIGTPKQRDDIYTRFAANVMKTRVLIISKDTWKRDLQTKWKDYSFETAIVDEAHFLRNWKTTQSKAIFAINAKFKYALTGTPAVTHGSDVYGLLHFIDPEAFPSYWQFTDRYWHIHDNRFGKDIGNEKSNRKEELRLLMDMLSVQRKRKEVMQWLPAATKQTIPVIMGKKQNKYYEDMFENFFVEDPEDEHGVDTMNKLSQMMRLRQICLDPRLLGFKEVGAKTTALLEFAESMNDPFVVMTMFSSYFKLVVDDLRKLGKRVEIIDGSVTKTTRNNIVKAFQNGKIDILLCNIIAAGTGLTLDRADTILFLDKSFSPADNEQAQDRIVPTTKERYHPINIISLVCADTVDERINDILDRKEDLTKIINKPELWEVLV